MKKMLVMAMMIVMTISANAMNYNAAKNEALFLSDKMAYELNLTDAQYDAVYEINLDYLMSVNGHNDVFGIWWDRRNADLRFVLNSWQYDKVCSPELLLSSAELECRCLGVQHLQPLHQPQPLLQGSPNGVRQLQGRQQPKGYPLLCRSQSGETCSEGFCCKARS